jgi:hypothetical protein
MDITKSQQIALQRLSFDKWLSAYESKVAMNTLQRLVDKGFLERKNDLGAVSFPLSGIKFRKKRDIIDEPLETETRILKRRKKRILKRRKK